MSEQKIGAALSRWHRLACEDRGDIYLRDSGQRADPEIVSDGYREDAETLADAYAAEHPTDDAEPVTAEWLESVGFVKLFNRGRLLHAKRSDGGSLATNIAMTAWTITDMKNSCTSVPRQVIRGAVRRLCVALGIELKEPK